MITLNKKNDYINFKIIKEKDIKNEFINRREKNITFISEEKTVYCVLNGKLPWIEMKDLILGFVKANKYNINFDLQNIIDHLEYGCAIQAITEGVYFASHKQFSLKEKSCPYSAKFNINCNCATCDQKHCEEVLNDKITVMEAINFARDLQDAPPNLMTPEIFAEKIKEQAKGIKNLTVKILDKKEIEQEKMGLLLAVNAGSYNDPRVVVLEYNGNTKSKEKTAYVGKGITFDSGGYNLKPSNFLRGMKFDMSGAAIVAGAVIAIAKLGLKQNISSVSCLTENRIGGKAILTESVVKTMNGKTVQIDNTDAEGRLVLADGLTYSVRNLKATKLVDAATLTGAIVVALGNNYTGVFSTNDEYYDVFAKAAKNAKEEIWRMPIHKIHFESVRSTPIADLSNIGKLDREAGSSTAAAFLTEFAEGVPFVHLDIAGSATNKERGTGVMLKTLVELAK